MKPYQITMLMTLLTTALAACQSGDLGVGQQIVTPIGLDVQLVDSMTVETATVLADTFATSADSTILVGQWTDTQTGRTVAQGFTSLGYVSNELPDRTTTQFDSLVLIIPLGTAYGDTTQLMTLNVHRLTSGLENKTYYNLDNADYEPAPLLTKTFRPWPRYNTRQIRLRIPDALGQDFFAKLQNRYIIDQETMDAYWKGLAFIGSETATTNLLLKLVIGSNGAGLNLYCHDNDLNQTQTTVRFPFANPHFSRVVSDRSNTPLRSLRTLADAVGSHQTQNTAFVAAGAMLRARLEIPALSQPFLLEKFRGINRAELVIEPLRRNSRDNAAPPAQLVLYQTNSLNEFVAVVPSAEVSSTVVGYYGYDPNDLEQKARYSFNLTYYISEVIKGRLPNRPLLMMIPESGVNLPVERLAFGDANYSGYRLKLRLYVTVEE